MVNLLCYENLHPEKQLQNTSHFLCHEVIAVNMLRVVNTPFWKSPCAGKFLCSYEYHYKVLCDVLESRWYLIMKLMNKSNITLQIYELISDG